ncbi:hypothetical protein GEMRC1_001007 [Eukaryota sp. GEM-RC1]
MRLSLLLIGLLLVIAAQAFTLPDSFATILEDVDGELFYADVDQKVDGFGRARMRTNVWGFDVDAFIEKVGVTGITRTVFTGHGHTQCVQTDVLFPFANVYTATLTKKEPVRYKHLEVDVYVQESGELAGQFFFVDGNKPLAFGTFNNNDYILEGTVQSLVPKSFSRNHFIKPSSIHCVIENGVFSWLDLMK